MQQRCSQLCAQTLDLHKPIYICVPISHRFIHKFYMEKSCSPASLLDRLCTLAPIPRDLTALSAGLTRCYPIISTFFHDYYQLQLRITINVCITEEFWGADENKVLF